MCEQAGAEPAELSVYDRYRTYVIVATSIELSRADYWIFSSALYHPVLADTWWEWLDPWFAAEGLSQEARGALTAARLCADGAWASEASGVMPVADLAPVRSHALRLVDEAERGGA